jgi:hypothetical protein
MVQADSRGEEYLKMQTDNEHDAAARVGPATAGGVSPLPEKAAVLDRAEN